MATSKGVAALTELNSHISSNRRAAKTWFGNSTGDFLKEPPGIRRWYKKLADIAWDAFLGSIHRRRIRAVFTIRKEDWPVVIKECLPVCHTWFRSRKEEEGECCWLYIYRSIYERLGKERVLQKVDTGFGSLGMVASLPAAQVDAWGLVVLAFADGAKTIDMRSDNQGGFWAALDARNFVLTLTLRDLGSQLLAHIEPKEHPDEDKKLLSDQESLNLLWYGHSFDPEDSRIGWAFKGREEWEPPAEMVDGKLDDQLKKLVLADTRVDELETRFREAIFEYYESWSQFLQKIFSKHWWSKGKKEAPASWLSGSFPSMHSHQLHKLELDSNLLLGDTNKAYSKPTKETLRLLKTQILEDLHSWELIAPIDNDTRSTTNSELRKTYLSLQDLLDDAERQLKQMKSKELKKLA